jgi:hypothetical protein
MFKVERERSFPKIERRVKMKISDIERETQAINPDSKRRLLVESRRRKWGGHLFLEILASQLLNMVYFFPRFHMFVLKSFIAVGFSVLLLD